MVAYALPMGGAVSRCRFVAIVLVAVTVAGFGGRSAAGDEVRPESGMNNWRQISAGYHQTCGVRTDDSLWCWGNTSEGVRTTPVRIGKLANWTAVSVGGTHTCALRTTGQLYCWGGDHRGQLGNGLPLSTQSSPVQVNGNRTDWVAVNAGCAHTCALRTSGRLFCWGGDDRSQLGNGPPLSNQSAPVQVAGNRTDWTGVSTSFDHTCARRTTGRLFCWGYDLYGQLGNGEPRSDQSAPVQVAGNRTDWTGVSAGQSHTCARRSTGRLFCWGAGGDGQLGNGQQLTYESAPVQVAGNRTNWTAVSVGGAHTCARNSNGRLLCWGIDSSGQLGDGGT